MRTFFYAGFRRDPWTPVLGQEVIDTGEAPVVRPDSQPSSVSSFDWATLISTAIKVGGQAYADDIKKDIEEGRVDIAEAQARVREKEAEARRAAEREAAGIAGIPTSYLVAGGIGLAAVIAVIALTRG